MLNSTNNDLLFLAHATEDKPIVRRLNSQLEQAGFSTWFDEKDLLPGQVWEGVIEEVIRKSQFFIVCLSRNLLSKEGYIQREIRLALTIMERKAPGTIYFIPVLLDDVEIPNIKVGTLNLADFHAISIDNKEGVEKLIDQLQKIAKVKAIEKEPQAQPCDIPAIKKYVADGNIRKALELLRECIEAHYPEWENEWILLSSRFSELERQSRLGLLTTADVGQQTNRITYSLLELIGSLQRA